MVMLWVCDIQVKYERSYIWLRQRKIQRHYWSSQLYKQCTT